ncbi:MAG TPA: hypothetical protein VLS94_11115, partial [Fusibacter sp.]|nr:hypothetical protein [Fusibacter sp.]
RHVKLSGDGGQRDDSYVGICLPPKSSSRKLYLQMGEVGDNKASCCLVARFSGCNFSINLHGCKSKEQLK